MNEVEEILLIKELLNKHSLPICPILEYAITIKEKQYLEELSPNKESIIKENSSKDIQYYCQLFSTLSVRKVNGISLPNKAILLLTIIKLISDGTIINNRINLDKYLTTEFAIQWKRYLTDKNMPIPSMWTPFYHLKSEQFWHFYPKTSESKLIEFLSYGGTPSIGKLKKHVEYAYIDDELFQLMADKINRKVLEDILIKNYINNY